MIQKLIDDMNHALDASCYLAALAIALMLPDICGKAAYPDVSRTGDRYKTWYNEYVGQFEKCPVGSGYEDEPIMPYLNGEVIYNLRNSFLHQGTPNIEMGKTKNPESKINHFELVIEPKNQFDLYSDCAVVTNEMERSYRVSIRRLCMILQLTSIAYYKENRDKFDFFNYTLTNQEVREESKW